MKKIIIFTLVLMLMGSVVLAAEQKGVRTQTIGGEASQKKEGQMGGEVQAVQTGQKMQNQGEETQIQTRAETQTREGNDVSADAKPKAGEKTFMLEKQQRAGTVKEAKEMIQERKQEMIQEVKALGRTEQKVYKNQNRVREAVHALLAMEDLVRGIGPQVSAIAREFNNSVEKTVKAEEKIQKRNVFVKLFMGGDKESADEVEKEVKQNKERVKELKQLMKNCNECGSEEKTMLQEQVENIEQEQERLQQIAEKEKKNKGMFGWIRRWFGR